MKKELVVKKNLDLLDEFMKYAFDHPDILDEIPRDASLVILPEGDLSLHKENKKTLNRLKTKGEPVLAVRLQATKRRVSKAR
jgi:hypothetical protein